MARWRVVEGQQVSRNGATFGAGEEFEANVDEADGLAGLAERVDQPKTAKAKDDD